MEEANCLRGKSSRIFLFSFLLSTCLNWSCTSEDTITLTFTEQQTPQNHAIHKIEFVDESRAYALGGNRYLFGIAQFSSDQGLTWSVDTIGEKTIQDFDLEKEQIYAAGYRGYYYSADTMTNIWKQSRPGDVSDIQGIVRQNDIYTAVGGIAFKNGFIRQLDQNLITLSEWFMPVEMNAIAKTNDQTLHAVGYGLIYRSVDEGETWIPNVQEGDNYQDVFFITNGVGWIVGQAGSILKTTDAGNSWSELRKPTAHNKENFLKIHFANEDRGVLVGEEGIVWTTQDGGDSWTVVDNLPDYDYTAVHIRGDIAWLGSEQGAILKVFL